MYYPYTGNSDLRDLTELRVIKDHKVDCEITKQKQNNNNNNNNNNNLFICNTSLIISLFSGEENNTLQ